MIAAGCHQAKGRTQTESTVALKSQIHRPSRARATSTHHGASIAAPMAASSQPPKVVQERLGHSGIMMTMDVYGNLFPRGDDSEELAEAERSLLT